MARRQRMPSDVDLYTVATGTSASRPIRRWLAARQRLVGAHVGRRRAFTAGNAFGLSAYPFFVVVDSSARSTRTSGELAGATWNALLEAAYGRGSTTNGSGVVLVN